MPCQWAAAISIDFQKRLTFRELAVAETVFPKVGRFLAASETPWGQWKRRAAEKFMTDTSFFPDEPAFCSMYLSDIFLGTLVFEIDSLRVIDDFSIAWLTPRIEKNRREYREKNRRDCIEKSREEKQKQKQKCAFWLSFWCALPCPLWSGLLWKLVVSSLPRGASETFRNTETGPTSRIHRSFQARDPTL